MINIITVNTVLPVRQAVVTIDEAVIVGIILRNSTVTLYNGYDPTL